MKNNFIFYIMVISIVSSCKAKYNLYTVLDTEDLVIQKVTDNTYLHTSYLNSESYGRVPCNGMIAIHNGESIVYDTPIDSLASVTLIDYIENKLNCQIKEVVATHFHIDCIGGLAAFHHKGIPSIANSKTIELAELESEHVPQIGFKNSYEHQIGSTILISAYLGEGHTIDNIVGYYPKEKVLFGGCLVKQLKAGFGNLDNANPEEWSYSIRAVKEEFPDTKIVIPGHGKIGGKKLLDYTIDLFNPK